MILGYDRASVLAAEQPRALAERAHGRASAAPDVYPRAVELALPLLQLAEPSRRHTRW